MRRLTTVVLRHETATGGHYDWLMEPADATGGPDGRLWAARVPVEPSHWPDAGRFDLEVIAPHRRHYLTWQGPVSGNRGTVRRVAEGWAIARLWTPDRVVLDLRLNACAGMIELHRLAESRWLAAWRGDAVQEATPED